MEQGMEHRVERFTQKAALVSAAVHGPKNLDGALGKALELLKEKPPLEPQMLSETQTGPGERVLAAPNLPESAYDHLSGICAGAGSIRLVRDGLRSYAGGIDMGITLADFGIAETGTLVVNSDSEETRLSTMLCETHVVLLPVSKIRETALSMAEDLAAMTGKTGSYTAFITGASRTADIERVLALGVHGPLELHIILVEG